MENISIPGPVEIIDWVQEQEQTIARLYSYEKERVVEVLLDSSICDSRMVSGSTFNGFVASAESGIDMARRGKDAPIVSSNAFFISLGVETREGRRDFGLFKPGDAPAIRPVGLAKDLFPGNADGKQKFEFHITLKDENGKVLRSAKFSASLSGEEMANLQAEISPQGMFLLRTGTNLLGGVPLHDPPGDEQSPSVSQPENDENAPVPPPIAAEVEAVLSPDIENPAQPAGQSAQVANEVGPGPDTGSEKLEGVSNGLTRGADLRSLVGESEFSPSQMNQIRMGLEKGLDVSVYAKEEFGADQMGQIRQGLEKGLDVSIFAKPEFCRSQMSQISRGLEAGIDVSIYATPNFSWEQMSEIRDGLEAGLDVSAYAKPEFSDDQMYQIRQDIEAGMGVSIEPGQGQGRKQAESPRIDTGPETTATEKKAENPARPQAEAAPKTEKLIAKPEGATVSMKEELQKILKELKDSNRLQRDSLRLQAVSTIFQNAPVIAGEVLRAAKMTGQDVNMTQYSGLLRQSINAMASIAYNALSEKAQPLKPDGVEKLVDGLLKGMKGMEKLPPKAAPAKITAGGPAAG